jgi:hypothetical protein
MRYTEYCLFSTQQRCKTYDQVKKQMYKVHQPHLRSGYVVQVRYEATTDAEGQPDWLLHYTPGPKARTDFAAFTRPLSPTAAAATLVTTAEDGQEALVATVVRERPAILPSAQPPASTAARDTAPQPTHPPATLPNRPTHVPPPAATDLLEVQVQALVAAFYQRFHGLDHVPASPKELDHATQLLTDHGEAKAHFLLTYAQQAAPATDYHPRTFMGILHYLPYALAAYDTQATQRAQAIHHQAIRTERRCQERYLAWRQEALAQLRSTCPPAVLAGLETAQRDRLMAASTPAVALDFAIRVAVDDVLAAQAELLPFEVWRQEQEEAR